MTARHRNDMEITPILQVDVWRRKNVVAVMDEKGH
jgi:hypothetical protein